MILKWRILVYNVYCENVKKVNYKLGKRCEIYMINKGFVCM